MSDVALAAQKALAEATQRAAEAQKAGGVPNSAGVLNAVEISLEHQTKGLSLALKKPEANPPDPDIATATMKPGDKIDDMTATQQADQNKKPEHVDQDASSPDKLGTTYDWGMVYAHANEKSDLKQVDIDVKWYESAREAQAKLSYAQFIEMECKQVANYANMHVEYEKFAEEARTDIGEIISFFNQGLYPENEEVKALAEKNGISMAELNSLRGNKSAAMEISSSSDPADAEFEKEKYNNYIADLTKVVARRRWLAKNMKEFYPNEADIKHKDFLPGASQAKDADESFKVQQLLNTMKLYRGVTMAPEPDNADNFTIKYHDDKSNSDITLVTGKRSGDKITVEADISGEHWEQALLIMVDQRKRLMGNLLGDDRSFPIHGTANPEKMLRLYQLAMLNNMKPTLNQAQIKHIKAYDEKNGTKYGERLVCLVKIKVETWWQDPPNKAKTAELEALSLGQEELAAIPKLDFAGKKDEALILEQHKHLVRELQDWHKNKEIDKFKKDNMGKTPDQLAEEAKKLEPSPSLSSAPSPSSSSDTTVEVATTPKRP